MQVLFILNDPPYGTERSYNGLRLALSLAKRPEVELRIFLMADAAFCAQSGQRTPEGSYNVERMLRAGWPPRRGSRSAPAARAWTRGASPTRCCSRALIGLRCPNWQSGPSGPTGW